MSDSIASFYGFFWIEMRGLFFTDLDGTLLDHETYEWRSARTGLEWCRTEEVAVIPCTSKTWSEVTLIRDRIGLETPAIVENGGAVVLSRDHTFAHEPGQRVEDEFRFHEFGDSAAQIQSEFHEIRQRGDFKCQSALNMSAEVFAGKTNLDIEEAERALERQFTVPVLWMESDQRKREFVSWCIGSDMNVQEGGRFLHLQRGCDKGRAVRWLTDTYREEYGEKIGTGGIGDSQNDVAMLQVVDRPFAVQKPGREHDQRILDGVENLELMDAVGPEGWTDAADAFLEWLEDVRP